MDRSSDSLPEEGFRQLKYDIAYDVTSPNKAGM